MGSILSVISNAFSVISGFLGFQGKRLDLKNAAAVQTAQAAQDEANARDKTRLAIATQDVKETRNELAE